MAFIFDMDGVLLDSEPLYYKFLNKKFDEYGISVSKKEYAGFVGLPTRQVWAYLKKTRELPLAVSEIMDREEEEVNEMFARSHLQPIDGLQDLLKNLKSCEIPMSVASSSAKSTIQLIVSKLGLEIYFDFLLSGTEVRNGKPHPDIFLKAAELHLVQPGDCIVIEDSTNGVKAAKRAGMTCVGFKNHGSGNQDLTDADLIIENYDKSSIDWLMKLFLNE